MDRKTIKSAFVGILSVYAVLCLTDGCLPSFEDYDDVMIDNNTLSEEDMIKIRTEMVKEAILSRLGLSERPTLSENVTLPNILFAEDEARSETLPDYYYDTTPHRAETRSIVLFPKRMTTKKTGSSKFTFVAKFHLESELKTRVTSVSLWVHRDPQNEPMSMTIAYKENTQDAAKNVLHSDEVDKTSPEWKKYDITEVVKSGKITTELTIDIECRKCHKQAIGTSGDVRPFVVIELDRETLHKRSKRNIKCSSKITHCCLQKYTVNFRDIEWDDWIIAPKHYEANYCTGDCISDVTLTRYKHSQVMQAILNSKKGAKVGLCCNPSRVSGLYLMYVVGKERIHKGYFPDLVVESCDCS